MVVAPSRYHKNHLYGEKLLTTPDPPEFAVFDTDFNARVGMFICFDVLFKEASELVSRFNVTLGVMSTWWFDQLPGWYSVAVQQAWSLRNGVPLLAAGIQNPKLGSVGSGIYSGTDGPRNYTYSPDFHPKLLEADFDDEMPVNPRASLIQHEETSALKGKGRQSIAFKVQSATKK